MKPTIKAILLLALSLLFITGCQPKDRTMLTVQNFETTMEKLTYEVETKEDLPENIESHLIAKTKNHRIDYYIFKTNEQAEQFWNSNSNFGENTETPSESENSITHKEKNLSIYEYEDENYYVLLSKVDRSVIYAVEHPVLKDTIVPIVEYLGYGKSMRR